MPRATQLSICLPNEPGALTKVTKALRAKKINILAISVVDNAEVCIVRLVTASAAMAKRALARFAPVAQPVVVLKLPDEVGTLDKAAGKLARAKINIDYVYGSAAGAGEPSIVVLGVSHVSRALQAIG
jgi:hypothetical protein